MTKKPKFKIGDKIQHIRNSCVTALIKDIKDGEYILSESCGSHLPIEWQNNYRVIEPEDIISEESKKVTEDSNSAREFLKDAGIMDENENLAKVYTQEEEVNNDLEEEYQKFLKREWFDNPGKHTLSEFCHLIAVHFANWQKEQMLKESFEAEAQLPDCFIPLISVFGKDKLRDIKFGEKVKVIIIKDGQ